MSDTIRKIENLSKQYRLGEVGTRRHKSLMGSYKK